jgi:hypothetical protein
MIGRAAAAGLCRSGARRQLVWADRARGSGNLDLGDPVAWIGAAYIATRHRGISSPKKIAKKKSRPAAAAAAAARRTTPYDRSMRDVFFSAFWTRDRVP